MTMLLAALKWAGANWRLVVVAVMAMSIMVEIKIINALRAKNELLASQVKSEMVVRQACEVANESLDATNKDVLKRLNDVIEQRTVDNDERDRLIAQREIEVASALAKVNEQRKERDALWHKTASCEGLGTIDVAAACGDVAQRLRDRAAVPGPR